MQATAGAMPMAPQAGAQPTVEAKELQNIVLLRRRRGLGRLDRGPFAVLYALITASLLWSAIGGQWRMFTYLSWGLGAAAIAHALAVLFTVWSVEWRALATCARARGLNDAELVKVVPARFAGRKEIVPLVTRVLRADAAAAAGLPTQGAPRAGAEGEDVAEVAFEYRRLKFVYHADTGAFTRLKFPVHEPFGAYLKATGYGSPERAAAAADVWGPNAFDVPVPPFAALLQEQMLAPFFVFQIFCVGLWCLDEYWYYSLFTLFMLVAFECTVVAQRTRTLRELRSLQTPKQRLATYRNGKWSVLPGEALLPGDIVSIGRPSHAHAPAAAAAAPAAAPSAGGNPQQQQQQQEQQGDQVVPADLLLLSGTCITEEAVLTGESTPQWKLPVDGGAGGAAPAPPHERLSIKAHRAHVLFGGTRVLQHTGDRAARLKTPDGGCLAVVLRTGFETSQGQLMRTILHSTERVTAGSADAALFIGFLLIFAVAAAYHVLSNGLADPTRDRFKLVLNCVMIITSVIPPELPMELTIAVNASLVALGRKRIFCTEPFRIPFAGRVDACCFDKTGTLTADTLLLEGIACAPGTDEALAAEAARAAAAQAAGADAGAGTSSSSKRSSKRSGGGGGGTAAAAAAAAAATPKLDGGEGLVRDVTLLPASVGAVLAACQSLVAVDGELVGDPLERAALEACGWAYAADTATSPDRKTRVTVLQRHHFSSALRRMSVIARVDGGGGSSSSGTSAGALAPDGGAVVLLKGAPEAVKPLLAAPPAGYDAAYKRFAAQGARVIALARLALPAGLGGAELRALPRAEAEAGLEFAGFAVFQCPLKPESAPTLAALAASSHALAMITGDAPLTAVHAAAQVHIVQRPALVLQHREDGHDRDAAIARHAPGSAAADEEYEWVSPDESARRPFSREWADVLLLAADHDLCITGEALAHIEAAGLAPKVVPLVQVFARAAPEQKELVIHALRDAGWTTLMVGDGTNDVGALKAAHVGVALLQAPPAAGPAVGGGKAGGSGSGGKGGSNKQQQAPKQVPPGTAMLEQIRKSGKPVPPHVEKMAAWMDKMHEENAAANGDGPPLVKPGDASMAAPFTAKAASVAPVADVLKQGRCTLVTTVQMFKILGLLCLSTAYALSVMYLRGVKLSDSQATLSGVLTAGMFFFISNAKPLPELSPARPHASIFTAYFFLSLLGQFAAQLAYLVVLYRAAVAAMPASEAQKSDSDFKPNLVNTVCYLVEQTVQLSVFAVNYVGHPFNESLAENVGMRKSLQGAALFLALLVSEAVPSINESFGLVPIPNALRFQFVAGAIATVGFCAVWERGLRAALPAPRPPARGYMKHSAEVARLRAAAESERKRQ